MEIVVAGTIVCWGRGPPRAVSFLLSAEVRPDIPHGHRRPRGLEQHDACDPEPGEHSGQSPDTRPSRSPGASFLQLTSLRQERVVVAMVA